MSETMIEVKNLSKFYGPTQAVKDISFTVSRGEIVGFLGPNGAGKSTTMKVLTGYLAPTSGGASVAGHDIIEDSLAARRRIGYLPENNPVYEEMVVYDYLCFIAELRGVPSRERVDRVRSAARRCGLKDAIGKRLTEMSKGYRQRVGLAQAMLHDPDILILDEPTSGLDPNQIVEIRELIKELGREKTVILSTHILPEVQATCGRVLIIADGKIAADGSPGDLQKKQGGARVNVTLRAPASEARMALQALPGVREVWAQDGASQDGMANFTLKSGEGDDPREQVFHMAVQRNWVLLGMTMEQVSLEEVFRKLTKN